MHEETGCARRTGVGLALLAGCILLLMVATSCSVRRFAVNRVGDALASGGSTYESDEDLELVGEALPFGLKLIESLLDVSPRHKGLLQTACQGFATYAYLYVQPRADALAAADLEGAEAVRRRARRLYLRAHRYGFRALERINPRLGAQMTTDPAGAVSRIHGKGNVPLLYWNAAALGLAISVSKTDASMLARIPEVQHLIDRAVALDEGWQQGALHEFQVVFAGSKPGKVDFPRIEKHYQRALELSRGERAGLYVAYAESVCVPRQDRAAFRAVLDKALAVDPERAPAARLQNAAAQRRARWLLEHTDDLFLPAADTSGGPTQ